MSVKLVNAVLDNQKQKMQFDCPGCNKNNEHKFDIDLKKQFANT